MVERNARVVAERNVRVVGAVVLAFLVLLFGWVLGDRAGAAQEISAFETHVSSTQAGGHPDVDYRVSWTNRSGSSLPCNCEDARILDMHFPTGFIGNPHNVPACSLTEFALHSCAPESQVGVTEIFGTLRQALFNLVPHATEPGLAGFYTPGANTPLFIVLHARTGSDYGLDATSSAAYHLLPLVDIAVHLWGVPADESHDPNRLPLGKTEARECPPYPGGCAGGVPSTATPAPYLQNPTTCGVPLTASHTIEYYTGTVVRATDDWPATTGCDQLTFNPSLTATATTEAGDSVSGLDVTLKVPQTQSPTAPSPSQIRSVTMTLPEGFSLAPNGANGKTACADEELSFQTEDEAHCPEFAKIGTSTIDSSALPGPINGSIYIGEPLPGQTYRAFVTGDGFATHVKLKGGIDLDPDSGRIVASFTELPQSPIQEVDLHFFGSERGIFATPRQCGSYAVVTRFTPWDGALEDQVSTSQIAITSGPNGSPCQTSPRPFHPVVTAGSADNTAGAFSPFTAEVTRADGHQEPTGITVHTPPGFLASLRGNSYCPESAIQGLLASAYDGREEQAAPSCPASSHVGSVKAGAGPGTRPLYVGGEVYLAGPFKGGPVSLVVVIPAISGPYDLGNVVTRVAVYLDPATARLSAVSDPLPRILEGVPLRARFLQIRLDRPDFTLNPTRCDPFAVATQLSGDEGGLIDVESHFQVANCSLLGYAPSLSLTLSGGLKVRGHPGIHAVFRARAGDANTRRLSVILPKGEQLDNSHIGTVCRRGEFAADACPSGSLIGHAKVITPLLDEPLQGAVYLRSSTHRLPDLAMDLEGQVDVELVGRVDAVNGRLRTTFESVPDAPVTSLTFDLLGRAKGLLINSESLCAHPKRVTVRMTGQNEDVVKKKPKLKAACGSQTSRKARRRG
jgi:hypothetical protein